MPKISGSYHGITAQPQFQTYPTAGMMQIQRQPQPATPPTQQQPPVTPVTPTIPTIGSPPNVLPQFGVSNTGNIEPVSDERGRLIRAIMNF
jgi:hypothetical protein